MNRDTPKYQRRYYLISLILHLAAFSTMLWWPIWGDGQTAWEAMGVTTETREEGESP